MPRCFRLLVLTLALALTGSVAFAKQVGARIELDESQAWDADGGQFLYQESHWLQWQGDQLAQRLVQYRCASGEVFAMKTVNYRAHPLAPDFHLRDARTGYEEGLRTVGAARFVFVRRNRQATLTEAELPAVPDDAPLVADAGFDGFLQQQWQTLLGGDSLQLRFLVPSALKDIAFKVRPLDAGDPNLVTARLSLGAWWGFLAPHIDATYRRADGRLLEYVGLSNLRDLDGDNYSVRIRFKDALEPADLARFQAAQRVQLVGTCPGEMRATSN